MTDSTFGSFFLAEPDDFPKSVAGKRWGDQERMLDLPGGPFLVTGLGSLQAGLMDREYASVTVAADRADADSVETRVFHTSPGNFRDFDMRGWVYTLDLDSGPDRLRLAGPHFMALAPWADGAPAGLWTPVEDMWFQGVIENYLRVLVAHRLLRCDGVLLHSSGVVIDESAYLFLGASGAGKSTLAGKALAAGAAVFSDDLNAAVGLSTQPAVVRLPFTGELRDQDTVDGAVPLRGIFVLQKGDSVVCEPLSPGASAAAVASTAPFVNCGDHNLDSLVDVASTLSGRVPVARLTTAKTSSFEEIKRAVLRFQK